MPKGEQCYAGITWYIEPDLPTAEPTLLVLKGTGSQSEAERIRVPVGCKADTLAFLHTYSPGPALRALWEDDEADEVVPLLYYDVRYADGTSHRTPVRWDREIRQWRHWGRPDHLPRARLAWAITEKRRRHYGALAVYAYEWENPRPDAEIAGVELISANTPERDYGAAAVLAISTGHRRRHE
jgi:hypothetical protein